MRFVLSTIGTSILTNQIRNDDPSGWRRLLRDSANRKVDELDSVTVTVINTLADRAFEQLLEDDLQINRRISAELNGIYGIYSGDKIVSHLTLFLFITNYIRTNYLRTSGAVSVRPLNGQSYNPFL